MWRASPSAAAVVSGALNNCPPLPASSSQPPRLEPAPRCGSLAAAVAGTQNNSDRERTGETLSNSPQSGKAIYVLIRSTEDFTRLSQSVTRLLQIGRHKLIQFVATTDAVTAVSADNQAPQHENTPVSGG